MCRPLAGLRRAIRREYRGRESPRRSQGRDQGDHRALPPPSLWHLALLRGNRSTQPRPVGHDARHPCCWAGLKCGFGFAYCEKSNSQCRSLPYSDPLLGYGHDSAPLRFGPPPGRGDLPPLWPPVPRRHRKPDTSLERTGISRHPLPVTDGQNHSHRGDPSPGNAINPFVWAHHKRPSAQR